MTQITHATILDLSEGKVFGVRLQGRLREEDLSDILPEMERIIQQHGSIRLLLELKGIQGVEAKALWDSLKFDARHFRRCERLALVGDEGWEKNLATLSKPFVDGEVRFFSPARLREAWAWLKA